MREGLHGSSHCTSLHLVERWADTEGSNLSLIQLTNAPLILQVHWLSMVRSGHRCWLSGPYLLCMTWSCYYCMLIRQLASLIPCFIWVIYQFWILLRSDGRSISNTEADLRWIKQKVCGGWLLLSCSINHLWLIEHWLFTVLMSSWCSCHSSVLAPSCHMYRYNRATCTLWMRHPGVEALSLPVWPH